MGRGKSDELIDSHVSTSQCAKAVAALVEHASKLAKRKEETELLPGNEENLWLVLSVKKVTPEKKLKPFKIPLAHPVVDPRTTSICLITKDPQREYKDLLESHNVKFINRVVGITKLKGKFKPFEARRMLLKENGMFLTDERVVPLLPGLLGKVFFTAKKQPIPVSLTKKELKTELEQAISSTYMHQNQGTCTSVKLATISQSPAHILENLKMALPEIVKRIKGGWDNIQSFHIKTNSSTSLPIWSCTLGEGEDGRWDESTSEDEDDTDEEPIAQTGAKKSKKRAGDEASEPVRKKAKKTYEIKAEKRGKAQAKEREVVEQVLPSPETKEPSKRGSEERPTKTKKSKDPNQGERGVTSGSDELGLVEKVKSAIAPKSARKHASRSSSSETHPTSENRVTKTSPSLPNSDVSKDDLKSKRLREGLEKKKEKIVKKRLGGSIKEDVVGKRSKSRI